MPYFVDIFLIKMMHLFFLFKILSIYKGMTCLISILPAPVLHSFIQQACLEHHIKDESNMGPAWGWNQKSGQDDDIYLIQWSQQRSRRNRGQEQQSVWEETSTDLRVLNPSGWMYMVFSGVANLNIKNQTTNINE